MSSPSELHPDNISPDPLPKADPIRDGVGADPGNGLQSFLNPGRPVEAPLEALLTGELADQIDECVETYCDAVVSEPARAAEVLRSILTTCVVGYLRLEAELRATTTDSDNRGSK